VVVDLFSCKPAHHVSPLKSYGQMELMMFGFCLERTKRLGSEL
jgi:hypothetical protein